MRYPSKNDYLAAVQRPDALLIDELRRAEFVIHPLWRIPTPAAGGSAVVFHAVLDGTPCALRFPTREAAAQRDRYHVLAEHAGARELRDCLVAAWWRDDAIAVGGARWPMLRMDWVAGRTLDRHVEGLVEAGDRAALAALAQRWRELVTRLQRAEFAHGDLQHGNVLVEPSGTPRLVDLDGAWVPRLAGHAPPAETGHRNYQPEHRPWGRWMDTFAGLVIYLSLRGLAREPALWPALHTGENLLFTADDFRAPGATPAWRGLVDSGDPELERLLARLRDCCAPGWSADGDLAGLLTPPTLAWWQRLDPVPPATRPEAIPVGPDGTRATAATAPTPPHGTHTTAATAEPTRPGDAPRPSATGAGAWWTSLPPHEPPPVPPTQPTAESPSRESPSADPPARSRWWRSGPGCVVVLVVLGLLVASGQARSPLPLFGGLAVLMAIWLLRPRRPGPGAPPKP